MKKIKNIMSLTMTTVSYTHLDVYKRQGCGISKTTRMLAQKQPYIQRVRNSSLVERSCAENEPGLNTTPKLRNPKGLVEEHC